MFSWIRPEVLKRPTLAKFIALLDNYVRSTGTSETETAQVYIYIYPEPVRVRVKGRG